MNGFRPWYGNLRQLSDDERRDWLRLYRSENVGPITFIQLLFRYKSAARAIEMLPILAQRGGRGRPLKIAPLDSIDTEIKKLHAFGGQLIAACEPDYPMALRHIDDPPPIIAVKGHVHLFGNPCIAIVGSRNASLNGRKIAHKMAGALGTQGYAVASGLSRGIDTAAHSGSLAHGTIAVVAGGLDQIYPKENTELFHQIAQLGLVVSEAPFGTLPQKRYFPRRNRIVSGISQGTVVVEAALRSGSLITARLALEQGREVMAVPGSPLDPRAAGTNKLIRDGATLVGDAEQVTSQLRVHADNFVKDRYQDHGPLFEGFEENADGNFDPLAAEKARISLRELLSPTPVLIDELIRTSQLSPNLVHPLLLELELAGIAQRLPGNRIMLIDTGGFGEEDNTDGKITLFDF